MFAMVPINAVTTRRAGGERRLFMAILEDAICRIRKEALAARRPLSCRRAQEDLNWLLSDSLSWPCSFLNVCAHLGLEPDWVRRQVLADLRSPGPLRWTPRPRSLSN
ncbi:MAG: hypothetical protein HY699_24415 [Deltaproteobacteria bacterium]|nr:hypothetical protein [Deltaproteobacteria bacterium]